MVLPPNSIRSSGSGLLSRSPAARGSSSGPTQDSELRQLGLLLSGLRAKLESFQKIGIGSAREAAPARRSSGASLALTSAEGDQTLSSVANLSGIGSGSFSINGVSIAVDPSVDTLNDVLTRINASSASVTSSMDPQFDFLTVRSSSLTAPLILADGTSSFFTGVSISTGTFRGTPEDDSLADAAKLDRLLEEIGNTLDEIFDPAFEVLSPTLLSSVQDELEEVIVTAFKIVLTTTKNVRSLRSGLGVSFDFTGSARGTFDHDLRQLERSARGEPTKLRDFLFRERDGLVTGLIAKLDELGATSLDKLDPELEGGFIVELRV